MIAWSRDDEGPQPRAEQPPPAPGASALAPRPGVAACCRQVGTPRSCSTFSGRAASRSKVNTPEFVDSTAAPASLLEVVFP